MRGRLLIFAAMCSVATPLCAQQRQGSTIKVNAIEKGEKPAGSPLITTEAMCDESGNIYSRPFDIGSGPAQLRVPIQRISPDAQLSGSFPVTLLPGGETRSFFVRNGRVYAPAISQKGELYVAELSPSGSVISQIKLQLSKRIDVWHLAVFLSGEYLLVGTSGMVGTKSHAPFAAVFAADGRLVKTIYEAEDEDARQKAEGGDPKYVFSGGDPGNLFVMFDAGVAVGSDNNVYLLHGGSTALIYAISPSGQVVRKLGISGFDPNLRATSIKSYGARLAIGFSRVGKTPENMVEVIDYHGNPIASYEVHEPPGDSDAILACYDHNGFTLVPRVAGVKPYFFIARLQ